jgi:hypothetical protein
MCRYDLRFGLQGELLHNTRSETSDNHHWQDRGSDVQSVHSHNSGNVNEGPSLIFHLARLHRTLVAFRLSY